jgi:hypothetical protein
LTSAFRPRRPFLVAVAELGLSQTAHQGRSAPRLIRSGLGEPVAVFSLFLFFMKKTGFGVFFMKKNRLRSFFMKKNWGASDLFIRQSNWVLTALKAPLAATQRDRDQGMGIWPVMAIQGFLCATKGCR